MTSISQDGRSRGEIILVVVAVGATLIPALMLVSYIRNLLAGDPPNLLWVGAFGVSLLVGLAGSGLLGVYLWNAPRSSRPSDLKLGLVGFGIASLMAFVPTAIIVVP